MPGSRSDGQLPAWNPHLSQRMQMLKQDVVMLAEDIGTRNLDHYQQLLAAEKHIEDSFVSAGLEVSKQEFIVENKKITNLEASILGKTHSNEIVVIAAHYDTVSSTPGADDNASGVATLLSLGRSLSHQKFSRTLRLVAFVNEEPPYYHTKHMGSLLYARRCKKRREQIVAMLSLEMLGYYDEKEQSQHYPVPFSWFYPNTGNFIAFIGNLGSRELVHQVIRSFRRHTSFPSEGVATFASIPGIGFSDQWSFWQMGYAGVMVTDTSMFRNPHYHCSTDTPDKLDFQRLTQLAVGLEKAIKDLLTHQEI